MIQSMTETEITRFSEWLWWQDIYPKFWKWHYQIITKELQMSLFLHWSQNVVIDWNSVKHQLSRYSQNWSLIASQYKCMDIITNEGQLRCLLAFDDCPVILVQWDIYFLFLDVISCSSYILPDSILLIWVNSFQMHNACF